MTREWDYSLLMLWLAAVTVGFVMVASASYPIGLKSGAPAHFVVRHGVYLFGGVVALGVCSVIPLRLWLDDPSSVVDRRVGAGGDGVAARARPHGQRQQPLDRRSDRSRFSRRKWPSSRWSCISPDI